MSSSKGEPRQPASKLAKGHICEESAASYYRRLGFDVLHRNWRAGHLEIDLIVRKGDLIAFVEVKSSSTARFGHPSERVDDRKVANLTRAARRYLADNDISECDLRFDVVTFFDGRLEHYPDAFPAPD